MDVQFNEEIITITKKQTLKKVKFSIFHKSVKEGASPPFCFYGNKEQQD